MNHFKPHFRIHHLFLLGIIALALTFRLSGVNWDANAHLHPDERFLTMVTTNITWPTGITQYFDTHSSPLNPHNKNFSFYVYGTYPVQFTKLAAFAVGKQTYDHIAIVGRILSALTDTTTVVLVFLIALYLSGNIWAGLLAAFCYSLYVLPIQLSHFFTVDPYVTFFTTFALYRAIRGKIDLFTGALAGLAVSAKISAFLVLPVIAVALLITYTGRLNKKSRKKDIIPFFWHLGLYTAGFLVTVRVAYPYLFDGWALNKKVLDNWQQLSSFNGATTTFPPGIQWINVSPVQVPLDLIVWGIGIPFGIVALLALTHYLAQAFYDTRRRILLIPAIWIILSVAYQSLQFAKPMRYIWPAYPMIAVLSGMMLAVIFHRILIFFRYRPVGILALWAICFGLLLWPLAYLSVYLRPNTRIQANLWIYTHIKPHEVIAWEHWDDPLPFPMGNLSPSVYTQIQLPSFDPDDEQKQEKISEVLAKSDYLILSSNRAHGAIHRANNRFPLTNRFYTRLFSGALGYSLAAQFVSRPALPLSPIPVCLSVPGFYYGYLAKPLDACETRGIHIIDDYADETFTVYDHPKVLIFRKTQRYSVTELIALLYD